MRRVTVLLLQIFFFSAVMSAQSVDDLIAKSIAAKGGMAKLKAIQTIRATGEFDVAGTQAQFVRISKRPNKVRIDITIQGMNMVRAFDGKNGWQIVPFTGKKDPEPMDADTLKQMEEDADIDGNLVDYKQKGHKVELIGKEKVEGSDAYHLKVTLKNGDVRDVFLDADSFLVIKTSGKTTMRGTVLVVVSVFGVYKEVDGRMVAISMDQRAGGCHLPPAKITLTKIEFNVPVEDAQFNMPPAAPAPAPKETTEPTPAKPPAATKPPGSSN